MIILLQVLGIYMGVCVHCCNSAKGDKNTHDLFLNLFMPNDPNGDFQSLWPSSVIQLNRKIKSSPKAYKKLREPTLTEITIWPTSWESKPLLCSFTCVEIWFDSAFEWFCHLGTVWSFVSYLNFWAGYLHHQRWGIPIFQRHHGNSIKFIKWILNKM